jgi:nucleotide-binding universal stress UspA family protein
MKFARILVGLDFSPASAAALAYARALAGDDGTVWMLHVAPASETTPSLATLAGFLGARGDRDERTEIRIADGGRPADELLRASLALGADAILLGAHAGAVTRLFLGSVSEEVARRSHVPVLVVRSQPSDDAHPITRVVVAVDHDDGSMVAARAGADLAARLGVRLAAVHVLPSSFIPPGYGVTLGYSAYDVAPFVQGRCSIEKELAGAVGAKTPVVLLLGSPASEILSYGGPGDLIVCGRRARSRLARLVFGSVTTGVLRHATHPILVVPSASGANASTRVCLEAEGASLGTSTTQARPR